MGLFDFISKKKDRHTSCIGCGMADQAGVRLHTCEGCRQGVCGRCARSGGLCLLCFRTAQREAEDAAMGIKGGSAYELPPDPNELREQRVAALRAQREAPQLGECDGTPPRSDGTTMCSSAAAAAAPLPSGSPTQQHEPTTAGNKRSHASAAVDPYTAYTTGPYQYEEPLQYSAPKKEDEDEGEGSYFAPPPIPSQSQSPPRQPTSSSPHYPPHSVYHAPLSSVATPARGGSSASGSLHPPIIVPSTTMAGTGSSDECAVCRCCCSSPSGAAMGEAASHCARCCRVVCFDCAIDSAANCYEGELLCLGCRPRALGAECSLSATHGGAPSALFFTGVPVDGPAEWATSALQRAMAAK